MFWCTASFWTDYKIYLVFNLYTRICFFETVPRNSNFWVLHVYVRCNSPYNFCILHARSILHSLGFLFINLLPAGTPGEKMRWMVGIDLTGGLLCSVCMVGSWSARHERCHVFLSVRCTFSLEKWDLQLRRNSNTSGSGLSGDRKNNLCWGVKEIQKKH